MVNIDMGGNTEFLTVRPGQTGPSNYPPGFFISSAANLTASTTISQAGATPITAQQVSVNSSGAGQAVILPQAIAGAEIVINNLGTGANTITVFATGSDTINGTAGATGVIQAISTVTIYYCFTNGAWLTK